MNVIKVIVSDDETSSHYNLKKIYDYDLNANSGFYKTGWEQLRDTIKKHQIPTIVISAIGNNSDCFRHHKSISYSLVDFDIKSKT